jgi:hypothetical protein
MKTALVILCFILGGCAVPQPIPQARYTKYGATQDEFMKDRYECLQQAQKRVSGAYVNQYGGASNSDTVCSFGMWVSCLGSRGYVIDPNGSLAAPPGMVVRCVR